MSAVPGSNLNFAGGFGDFGGAGDSNLNNSNLKTAREWLADADALLIGASNGLSIAEGYNIFARDERFERDFGDMAARFGFGSVLEGCFARYPDVEARDEFFRRLNKFWVEDYEPSAVMKNLREIVGKRDYFVVTSNGDTHLELSGFESERVFEIEGTFASRFESVEDKSEALNDFIARNEERNLVILELGIGRVNALIKPPLARLGAALPLARYIALNLASELCVPPALGSRALGVAGDMALTLAALR